MTTALEPDIRRPGPDAWTRMVVAEGKMVVRDTAGLIIPLGMPLLILVMQGMSMTGGAEGVFERYVMPVVLTMVIAIVGVVNMPSFLSYYRRTRVLRRLAVTPASPAMILTAQVVVSAIQSVIGILVGVVVAMAAFDVGPPERPGTAIAVLALVALTMYSVGMLVAAIAPTGNASIAIGLSLFFAFGATGGMFGPTENLPEAIAVVGEALPFGAAVQAVGDAWVGNDQDPTHLVAMLIAILVSGAIALKWFRWDS